MKNIQELLLFNFAAQFKHRDVNLAMLKKKS